MIAALVLFAKNLAAPEKPVLMTMISGCIWSIVIAVSRRVSPFFIDELLPEMLIVSAPRFFPASSKDVLVLVDSSMKKLIWVFPLRREVFFIPPLRSFSVTSARSNISFTSSFVRSSKLIMSLHDKLRLRLSLVICFMKDLSSMLTF